MLMFDLHIFSYLLWFRFMYSTDLSIDLPRCIMTMRHISHCLMHLQLFSQRQVETGNQRQPTGRARYDQVLAINGHGISSMDDLPEVAWF